LIKIGLVGCGGIARRHIEGYRRELMGQAEVVAGCDPNPETLDDFCKTYNVSLKFSNAQEMIASGEVDVISLLTPPAIRDDAIYPAFEAGIHVLVEKPFAERLSDALAFVKAAEAAGVKLAVNQQLRFMQDMVVIQEAVTAGTLGDIRHVDHDHYQNRTRTRGWRCEELRLEISIFSIHILDRVRALVDVPPKTISAETRAWDPNVKGETFTSLRVVFENDAVGTMLSSWHGTTLPECRLRIDGTLGSAVSVKESVLGDSAVVRMQTVGGDLSEQTFHQEEAFTHAMGGSMKRLVNAIETGTEPPHSGRDNLETMQIVDGAYLSADRGEPVTVEELKAGLK
jgi:predicted dehydrogenase